MTGELTLRGHVLPIGGVKEKVLGALRAGVAEVILPQKNGRDLVEIPAAQRARLTFHLAERMEQILELVLGPPPPKPARRGARAVITKARGDE